MMSNLWKSVLKGTLLFSLLLMFSSIAFFWVGEQQGIAVLSGVLLSSIAISSSAWIFDKFKNAPSKVFTKVFFISTLIRFFLILALFGILVGVTKIDEIYFTVSFIISYLCQSVTEIIFINKILQKSSS